MERVRKLLLNKQPLTKTNSQKEFSLLKVAPQAQGFSLLEVSIVLMVMALLLAGVLQGFAWQDRQKLNNIMSHLQMLDTAVTSFEEKYGALPGDLYDAEVRFGGTDGNGNGIIDGDEGTTALQHLALAELINGSYNGSWTKPNLVSNNVLDGKVYFASDTTFAPISPIMIRVAKVQDLNNNRSLDKSEREMPYLSARMMQELDMKFDDGLPNSGRIRASNGTGAENCVENGQYSTAKVAGAQCYFDLRIRENLDWPKTR